MIRLLCRRGKNSKMNGVVNFIHLYISDRKWRVEMDSYSK
jgi:hypothetical protein